MILLRSSCHLTMMSAVGHATLPRLDCMLRIKVCSEQHSVAQLSSASMSLLPSHSRSATFSCSSTAIGSPSGTAPSFKSPNEEEKEEMENIETSSDEEKSDEYSSTMTHAMGAVLTYRHELGMNYNFVLPDLIVGSCLQTPSDVDRLKKVGVKTIFCLQQDPDLEYFGVDICAIQDRAKEIGGIEHIREQIRDFDPFDLRKRLPAVVATLYKAVQRNKGITYIHCTAGLGRAPAVALAYMFWLLGYELLEANEILLSVRPCFPKLEAIRNATCDLLTGGARETIHLKWPADGCQSVEISGLDVGWGQMLPLTFVPKEKHWILSRELLVGKYEYKYIVDGVWTTNHHEPLTQPNKDGHINNFVELTGGVRTTIHLKWPNDGCQSVEISGLDVGWGQMLALTFVPKENHWILHRELLVGKYEYKYIVDGSWRTNHHEPLTRPNMDGHINNFVEVVAEFEDAKTKNLRRRVMQENPILNGVEHRIIHHNFFHLLPSLFFKR